MEAKADVEAAVHRNADYTVRKTLEKQQKTLDEQQRLIEFYSLLLAQGKTKEGLELNGLLIRPLYASSDSAIVTEQQRGLLRRYSYQLVFVQYSKRHRLLNAQVKISLLGTQDGEARFLNVRDLQSEIESKDGKDDNANKNVKQFGNLRFKYFQKMEGQLTLPVGFVPEQIVIDATIKKKNAKPWQRIVDWQTED